MKRAILRAQGKKKKYLARQAKLREEEEKRLKKWKERGVPQQLKREKIEEEREARAEERRWRAAQKHLKYQIETGNS